MSENKSEISKQNSYVDIGKYWDSHDLDEIESSGSEVEFDVEIRDEVFYYAIDTSLSSRIHSIAAKRGVSTETLVNLWLSEKADQELAEK